MKTLFGGGGQSQQNQSANGYSALPAALQAGFNGLGTQVGALTNPSNPGVTNMFTPTPMTAGQNTAIGNINAGFAPTADSISSDMAMQNNPFMSSVIDAVNRNGQGQYGVMKQAMDAAGLGPDNNRSLLGANDIQQTTNNTVGQLLSQQFNTQMNNALTTLPTARASDANMQMTAGTAQQTLANQTKLAPIAALLAGTGMIAPFTAGGTSSGAGSGSNQGGIISSLAGPAAMAW